jgi:hypothetical protein
MKATTPHLPRRRRALSVLLVVCGGLAIAGFAYSSDGPNAQLVNQDRIYGGGGTEPGCFVPDVGFCRQVPTNFAIDAHGSSTGRSAYGDWLTGGDQIQVTCIAVDGTNGVVGGITTASVVASHVGWLNLQFLTDNGALTAGGDAQSPLYAGPADPAGWPPGFPYVCPSPDTSAPNFGLIRSFLPISRGDIVVQDTNP